MWRSLEDIDGVFGCLIVQIHCTGNQPSGMFILVHTLCTKHMHTCVCKQDTLHPVVLVNCYHMICDPLLRYCRRSVQPTWSVW